MNRSLVLLAALTAVASLQVPSVTASIIGPGTKIGFDIQGGTSGTTTYSFPGVLLNRWLGRGCDRYGGRRR